MLIITIVILGFSSLNKRNFPLAGDAVDLGYPVYNKT